MSTTATQADPQLIALALRSSPESVPIARRQVRAALSMHGLGEYADDAEIITADSSPTRSGTPAATTPRRSG